MFSRQQFTKRLSIQFLLYCCTDFFSIEMTGLFSSLNPDSNDKILSKCKSIMASKSGYNFIVNLPLWISLKSSLSKLVHIVATTAQYLSKMLAHFLSFPFISSSGFVRSMDRSVQFRNNIFSVRLTVRLR